MQFNVETEYQLGQIVYLKVGDMKGIVTGILTRPGTVLYFVGWSDGGEGCHYEMELSESESFA
jgi:hypothetical protein